MQKRFIFLLQQSLQLLGNRITDFGCLRRAANVRSANVLVDDDLDRLVDLLGQLGLLQRVFEHHGDGEEGRHGVDDALAANVRGGTYGAIKMSVMLG